MSRQRSAPLISGFSAAIAWMALLAGFTLGVVIARFSRGHSTAQAPQPARPLPLTDVRAPRHNDGDPAEGGLFRAHALEIVIGLAVGAVALAVTIYLFTRSS